MSYTRLTNLPIILKRHWLYLGRRGFANNTLKGYRYQINLFLHYIEENESVVDLKDIDKNLLLRYQSYLTTVNISLRTVSARLSALTSLFSFLEYEDLILANPARHIERPKVPKTLPRGVFTQEEIARLLDGIPTTTCLSLRDKALLEIMYSTGLRSAEAAGLLVVDFDRRRREILIRHGKGGYSRVLPVGDTAALYLAKYLDTARPKLIRPKTPTPFIWVSQKGGPLTPGWIPNIVRKYALASGIARHVDAHMIRHSVATHMLENHAPTRYIQELLGHRTITTTERYTHVEIGSLREVHEKTHPRDRAS